MDVVGLGVEELRVLLDAGKVTSAELVTEYLRRIGAFDAAYDDQPGLSAIITVNPAAEAVAKERDAERQSGDRVGEGPHQRGPLHGIPIVVKDNYDSAGMPTTIGSQALADLRPTTDATQVRRLQAAGAIVVAKTNLHEFAMSITTVSSLGGQTRNPYDQTRHPGGSSGGTAAAVAASFAAAGLGTDTAGSIRIPAAHNNLVGLRPTLGLTSRAGIAPLASTQDTGGPIAMSVRDAAMILDAIAGYDPLDPVTGESIGRIPDSYLDGLSPAGLRDAGSRGTGLKGKRLGVFADHFGDSVAEDETNGVIAAAIDDLAAAGAEVVRLDPYPDLVLTAMAANVVSDEFEPDLNTYLATAAAGQLDWLAMLEPPYDTVTLADIATSGLVTPSVLSTVRAWVDRPERSTAEYAEKLRQRELLKAGLTELFDEYELDALVYPTIKQAPTPVGTTQDYLNCQLAASAGFPALSVPAGFTTDGLPVGIELLGPPFSEPDLLGMGYAYEQATGHRTPPQSTPRLSP